MEELKSVKSWEEEKGLTGTLSALRKCILKSDICEPFPFLVSQTKRLADQINWIIGHGFLHMATVFLTWPRFSPVAKFCIVKGNFAGRHALMKDLDGARARSWSEYRQRRERVRWLSVVYSWGRWVDPIYVSSWSFFDVRLTIAGPLRDPPGHFLTLRLTNWSLSVTKVETPFHATLLSVRDVYELLPSSDLVLQAMRTRRSKRLFCDSR